MSKLSILKDVTELVVSIGVSAIVGNGIKLTVKPDTKIYTKVAMGVGGFVLSHMVGDMAGKYATDKIDEGAATLDKVLHPGVDPESLDLGIEPDEAPTDNVTPIINADKE